MMLKWQMYSIAADIFNIPHYVSCYEISLQVPASIAAQQSMSLSRTTSDYLPKQAHAELGLSAAGQQVPSVTQYSVPSHICA